jgi:hypothetical protein
MTQDHARPSKLNLSLAGFPGFGSSPPLKVEIERIHLSGEEISPVRISLVAFKPAKRRICAHLAAFTQNLSQHHGLVGGEGGI